MLKDYSGCYIAVPGRNRLRTPQRNFTAVSRKLFPVRMLMWKSIGAMLLLTLIFGISSTLWYGQQVKVSLDQVGRNNAINKQLHNENKNLLAQHDMMLTRNHMEQATQKLGLRSPAKKQLRYP